MSISIKLVNSHANKSWLDLFRLIRLNVIGEHLVINYAPYLLVNLSCGRFFHLMFILGFVSDSALSSAIASSFQSPWSSFGRDVYEGYDFDLDEYDYDIPF